MHKGSFGGNPLKSTMILALCALLVGCETGAVKIPNCAGGQIFVPDPLRGDSSGAPGLMLGTQGGLDLDLLTSAQAVLRPVSKKCSIGTWTGFGIHSYHGQGIEDFFLVRKTPLATYVLNSRDNYPDRGIFVQTDSASGDIRCVECDYRFPRSAP